MVTRRAISFEADLDISDVMRGLNRIERQARSVGGTVGRVGGGLGRAGGGIGRTVGAGAGLGAGLAVFEQVFERIFELFEDTPVLETFTMALDTLLKAFGPLIGVLLENLAPVITALVPAIEPLARALTPLIELMGAGLLVAVQLLVPGITLLAQGLEYVTSTIRDVALQGIQFVVDQLNKLPFVNIEANLTRSGLAFDAMAIQIKNAGDEAGKESGNGATAKVKALAEVVEETGRAADNSTRFMSGLQFQLLDAASNTEILRNNLATANGTFMATIEATRTSVDSLTILEGHIERLRIAGLDATQGTDLFRLSLGEVPEPLGRVSMALMEVASVASASAAVASQAAVSARRYVGSGSISRARGSGTQTSSVRVDENGNLIYGESFRGGDGAASSSQRLFSDPSGNVFYDPSFRNPASSEAQQLADSITVNVQVGDETVDAVTEASNQRASLTGR